VSYGVVLANRSTREDALRVFVLVNFVNASNVLIGSESTNLDAIPAGRGSRVLALIPTAGAALTSLRTATTAATAYESAALRARGAEVETIVPDEASLKAIGANLMDGSRRDAVAAAGYAQGRRVATASV